MLLRRTPISTCCLAVIVLTACQSKQPAPPAQADIAPPAAAEPPLLRVTASDFSFDAPDQTPAGLTTVRLLNKGPSLHHIELVRLEQGKSLADFLTALKAGGPPPAWAAMIGGPNDPEFGDSTTVVMSLDPGNYAMICVIPGADGMPHVMKGMAHALTVTGPANAAQEPVADVTVKLVDYDFQFSQELTAGHHAIRIENAGQQVHEVVFVRLNSGKTAMDVANWAQTMAGPPPGVPHGGISGIMPGEHVILLEDLPAGNYALFCFFPDVKDGKPHFVHGMMKQIKVD